MNFLDITKQRESCRAYSGKPIEREKLVRVFQAVSLSPSACNSQPYEFIVAEGEKLQQLVENAGITGFVKGCGAMIVQISNKVEPTDVAPKHKYTYLDSGIAHATLCYAATEEGLSTCLMGTYDEQKVKDILGIGEDKTIHLVTPIGYATDKPLRKKVRKPLSELVKFVD